MRYDSLKRGTVVEELRRLYVRDGTQIPFLRACYFASQEKAVPVWGPVKQQRIRT